MRHGRRRGSTGHALVGRSGYATDEWRVDVPGGTLRVRALPGQEVELAGPAVLVADGVTTLCSPEAGLLQPLEAARVTAG